MLSLRDELFCNKNFRFYSTAHKDITDAITSAKDMTKEAINAVAKSQEELYPSSGMSVIDIGMISLKNSHDIQQDALREIDKLGGEYDYTKYFQGNYKKKKNKSAAFIPILCAAYDNVSLARKLYKNYMRSDYCDVDKQQKNFYAKTLERMSGWVLTV